MKTIRKIFAYIVLISILLNPTLSYASMYQDTRGMLSDSNYFTELNRENINSLTLRESSQKLSSIVTGNDYGKTINYSVTVKDNNGNDVNLNDWKILYNDGTNVYIMLGDYLENKLVPSSANILKSGKYGVYWDNSVNSSQAVSILNNNTIWADFAKGNGGETATGAPNDIMVYSSYCKSNVNTVADHVDVLEIRYPMIHSTVIEDTRGYWISNVYESSTNAIVKNVDCDSTSTTITPVNGNSYNCYVLIGNGNIHNVRYGSYALLPVVKLNANVTGTVGDTIQLNLVAGEGTEQIKAKPNTAVVIKCEEDTETPLQGAEITLYNSQEQVLGRATTNEKGKVDFANVTDLVPGTYYYRETGAPNGYVLNNTLYSFVVDNEGNVKFNRYAIEGAIVKTSVPEGYIGIYTPLDLDNIRNNLTGKYILMNDIDMSSVSNFEPIAGSADGSDTTYFDGILDGNYHKISNLNIESKNFYIGLFGYTGSYTIIKNLELENETITVVEPSNTSTIIGCVTGAGSGMLKRVKVTKNSKISWEYNGNGVSVSARIGGIAGNFQGIVDNCSTNIEINCNGGIDMGGLFGEFGGNGTIRRAYSNVKMNLTGVGTGNPAYAGGIVGGASNCKISEAFSTGEINKEQNLNSNVHIGGIAGNAEKMILEDVYSNIKVNRVSSHQSENIGGIIGDIWPGKNNIYRDSITTIKNAYYSGEMNVTLGKTGGIVADIGWNGNIGTARTVTNSYWSPEVSGVDTSEGGESRTQAQMQTQSNYENWDFEDIWGIDEGTSYPYFLYLNRGVIYDIAGEGEITGGPVAGEGTEQIKAKPNTAVVTKYEEDTNTPVAGAEISLYNSQNEYIGKATTNEKGKVDFASVANLVPGTYYYKETKAPSGYIVNDTLYSFVVDSAGNVTFSTHAIEGAVVKTSVPEGYIGIYTAQDLNNIRNNLAGKYILMNDIDMSSVSNFEPIGDATTQFTGILDGNYKKINNLKITSDKLYVGLFGYANKVTIENLELYNVSVKSTSNSTEWLYIGTLGGRILNNSNIKNVNVTGNSKIEYTVNKTHGLHAGGLVAICYGNIEKCSTSITMNLGTAPGMNGGLVSELRRKNE